MIGQGATPGLRLAATALFVGVPAALAALAILNLLAVGEHGLSLAERGPHLLALQRRLAVPAVDGRPLDTSAIYMNGASRSLASANLQQQLVDAIAATAGRLIETAVLEPSGEADNEETDSVRLKATLDIDNNGLLQLLFLVESGVPLLDVETLAIRRLEAGADTAADGWLRVDMTVRARWKQDEIG